MELQLRIRHEKERLKRENPNAHLRTRTPSLELDTRYIGFEYSCDYDICSYYISSYISYQTNTTKISNYIKSSSFLVNLDLMKNVLMKNVLMKND